MVSSQYLGRVRRGSRDLIRASMGHLTAQRHIVNRHRRSLVTKNPGKEDEDIVSKVVSTNVLVDLFNEEKWYVC